MSGIFTWVLEIELRSSNLQASTLPTELSARPQKPGYSKYFRQVGPQFVFLIFEIGYLTLKPRLALNSWVALSLSFLSAGMADMNHPAHLSHQMNDFLKVHACEELIFNTFFPVSLKWQMMHVACLFWKQLSTELGIPTGFHTVSSGRKELIISYRLIGMH